MPVQKFSQIAASSANIATGDSLLGVQGGTTDVLFSPAQALALTNTRLAKTSNYTVQDADKGVTFALGGNAYFTLTFNAASGYNSRFAVMVLNEDTARAKLISCNGLSSFYLWPGQTAIIYNQNNTWVVSKPSRWKLTGTVEMYVDTTSGSDSTANDGMASGSAFLTVEHLYHNIVQALWDIGAQTINCNMVAATTSRTVTTQLNGPLVGQTSSVQFAVKGQGVGSTTISSTAGGVYLFYAAAGSRFLVDSCTLQNTGTTGGCLLVGQGQIAFSNITFNAQCNSALDVAGSESSIFYAGGSWTISSATACNIFAVAEDGGMIYLGGTPGLTISGSPSWTTAFVQADLGGIIEGTGFTGVSSGSPTGPRYNMSQLGIVFTGAGTSLWGSSLTFFPGNSSAAVTQVNGGNYS